jgi:hypothetical protein
VKPTQSAKPKSNTPFPGAIPFALIGLISSAIGFFPTFFVRLDEVDFAHLVHGWTMIGWLVLVLVQALLIRSRRYRVHRVLGWSSLALFVAMIVTSCQMVILMLSGKSGLPYELAKFFAYSDIVDTPLMLILFGGAIILRKNRHLHSRLIAATVLVSIVPGLARMFNILIWRSMEGLFTAMHPTYLLILGVLGIAIYVDHRANRLRWPLPLTFVWFSGVYATQWVVVDMAWYEALTRSIGSLA